MQWQIEKGIRCDLVAYAAPNMSGKRTAIRIFPGGNRKGDVASSDLRSLVVRTTFGTRVVLVSEPGPTWEAHPWRCIRLLEQQSVPTASATGLPGVRIPDLEFLDPPDAKRTNTQTESSYPLVQRLADGDRWTFGRGGDLKGRVRLIRIERDRAPEDRPLPDADRFARILLEQVAERDRAAAEALLPDVVDALRQTLIATGQEDADERARQLEEWARSQ